MPSWTLSLFQHANHFRRWESMHCRFETWEHCPNLKMLGSSGRASGCAGAGAAQCTSHARVELELEPPPTRRQRGDASTSQITATSLAESHTSTTRHVPAPGTGRRDSIPSTNALRRTHRQRVRRRPRPHMPPDSGGRHSIDSIPTDHGWLFLLTWRRSARQAWVGAPSGETSLAASPSPASDHRRDIGSPCAAATGDLDCALLRA
jgi:hypothetical protein